MHADEPPPSSVWTRPKRRQRELPALTAELIVAEAVRLLDEEGAEALSMRRLAGRLGAVATAIYWHVANKDELLELVVDHIATEIEVPDVEDPAQWRAAAAAGARSMRASTLRHPWVVSVLGGVGLSYLGPNTMRVSEQFIALFAKAGCTLVQADHALNVLLGFVVGATSREATMLAMLTRSGADERAWAARLLPAAQRAAEPYPLVSELYAMPRGPDPARDREDAFELRLARVLDGLAVWVDGRAH